MSTIPTSTPSSTSPAPTGLAAARAGDATKVYGSGDTAVTALDEVSVDLPAGRFTAVMGPSGSGKSTLMHCVAGLDTLTEGRVFIGDVDLGTLSDKELTARPHRLGVTARRPRCDRGRVTSAGFVPQLVGEHGVGSELRPTGQHPGDPQVVDHRLDVVHPQDVARVAEEVADGGERARQALAG
jgi:putative ABC transport system ATP-binding protein